MGRGLIFSEEQSTFCCGLAEIGDFRVEETEYTGYSSFNEDSWEPMVGDMGYLATTLKTQTGAAKRLKRLGFKKLATWTRSSGARLYLWGYFPRKRKKRRRK